MSYRHRSNVGSVLSTLPGAPGQKPPPRELPKPKQGEMGFPTGATKGELIEAWNPNANKGQGANEFHSALEWMNLRLRDTPLITPTSEQEKAYDKEFPPLPNSKPQAKVDPTGKTPMTKVESGKSSVSVLNDKWKGGAEARLKIERQATVNMRKNMTSVVNARKGKAAEGVKKNSEMAQGLAGLLKDFPEIAEEGGLVARIVGKIDGQGQHPIRKRQKLDDKKQPIPVMEKGQQKLDKKGQLMWEEENEPADVPVAVDNILKAAERLGKGKGQKDDGNVVMQFIGCFVDGLTEVNEAKTDPSKKKAADQFDKLWPAFAKAFKLKDSDKDKLLNRVAGFKEIAGGAADTISGKGTRKGDTRGTNPQGEVRMPNDPRLKIDDDNALIKNDISGSMHSCLLAQELAESLMGGGIKDEGDPVVVKDKDLINARAFDALALTAGGMLGESDLVMHTAYEMINGMQAITGLPPVSQVLATEIMDRMKQGTPFTDAVEPFFDDKDLPWKQ